MEAHVAATDPLVIDGLQYKLKPNGQYITSRQSVSFHPSGSNVYKPVGGTRVLRIVLADGSGGWLDPQSVKLFFDVVNEAEVANDATATAAMRLRPLSPWGFFKKMRITCAGSLVEDISEYSRTHEMFHMMKPADIRDNDTVEGFEYREGAIDDPTAGNMAGIKGGSKKTVCFTPLSGLLQCGKMLPLAYMKGGLVLEMELCNSFEEPLVVTGGSVFTAAKNSQVWRLENCQVKADILQLDNGFQNSYDAHMLEGGMLAINFQGYVTSQQSIVGDKVTVNLSRQASHLKGVFVSFHKSKASTDYLFKEWNKFYHPMNNADVYENNSFPYDIDHELELQIQIGGKTYPQTPCSSIAESWSQLRKAVARYGKHPVSITPAQYHSTKYVFGLDMEALPEVGYTGLSTKNGEMITVKVKALDIAKLNVGSTVADGNTHMPTSLFMVLCTDNILELRDSGVSVLD
jgi:hypothetical protein